jgi:hypothetical protein
MKHFRSPRTLRYAIAALLLVSFGVYAMAAGTVQSDAVSSTPLRLQIKVYIKGNTLSSESILVNTSARTIQFSYSPCDFGYRVVIRDRVFTSPTNRPFEFTGPCATLIKGGSVPGKSSIKLSAPIFTPEVNAALKASRLSYQGEFRFRYSIVGSGRRDIAVYKTTQRK